MMSNINAIRLLGLLLLLLSMSGCASDAPSSGTADYGIERHLGPEEQLGQDGDTDIRFALGDSVYVLPLADLELEWKGSVVRDCYQRGDDWTLIRPELTHYVAFIVKGVEFYWRDYLLLQVSAWYDGKVPMDVACGYFQHGDLSIYCDYHTEQRYYSRNYRGDTGSIFLFKCDTTKYTTLKEYNYLEFVVKTSTGDTLAKRLRAYKSDDYRLISNNRDFNLHTLPDRSFYAWTEIQQASDEEICHMNNAMEGFGISDGTNEGMSFCDQFDSIGQMTPYIMR